MAPSDVDGLAEAVDPAARSHWRRWWPPLALWTVGTAAALTIQYLARRLDPDKSHRFLDGWSQFDGPEYLSIATHGYQQRQLVWFPAYPTLVRAIDAVLGDPLVAGVVVSAIAGLVATVLFWWWTEDRGLSPGGRVGALLVLLLYPYGWFLYGVVYSDALFLAAALGAFVLLERGRPGWAALAGAVATAARPSGFTVAAGLWILWWERTGVLTVRTGRDGWGQRLRLPLSVDRSRLRASSFVPLLSLAGLAAFMTYTWISWGSPFRFVSEQSNYHAGGRATLLKQQYFEAWSQGYDGRHLATTTAQAIVLLLVLGAVPAVGRRFGWGYAIYVLGLCLLPAVSVATFMGTGRYLLPAFPVFALVGAWLEDRPRVRVGWVLGCTAILVVMVFGYSRSWYLT